MAELKPMHKRGYSVLDIETSTHVLAKRKASPFHPDNKIVAAGWKSSGDLRSHGWHLKDEKQDPAWFRKLLDKSRFIAGFNISFDLLHILNDEENLQAWMKWVADGGLVWDCQLAEYLLRGMVQEAHMLSLDEVAPLYGGQTKVDEVKLLWEAGVQTEDIDSKLLMDYLLGEYDEQGREIRKGDITNTEAVFLGQLGKAKASGKAKSILLNMGALIAVIEMQRNGMKVDLEKGLQMAEELQAEVRKLTLELETYLPDGLPFEFNWNSRFHKSALIFGGKVKYKAKANILDDQGNLTYFQKDEVHVLLANGGTMEFSLWEHLQAQPDGTDTEPVLYTSGKNKGQPKTKKVKVPDIERGPKQRLEDFEYQFPGFAKPQPQWEGSDPGVYSVASDVIEELAGLGIPFLDTLAEVEKKRKDLGTYFIVTDDDGNSKGMLTLVGPDGLIHGNINMTSTVTGRFSASNPNLQNLPRKGAGVKLIFVSRFPGGKIAQSDFTSLEVYIQAILTGDKNLIEHLRQGLDMHCMRLSVVENMPYDKVYHLCRVALEPEWDEKRTNIKVFSFQRAYGAGAPKIAAGLKVPVEQVEAWVEADKQMYPQVESFYEGLARKIARSRVPTAKHVQHPTIRGLNIQLGKGSYTTPDGKEYVWIETPAPDWQVRRGTLATFMPTEIRNYPVQGTGGEWMKAAMYLMVRSFYARGNFDGKALLINTVHDAAYGDFHPDVAYKATVLMHACMEAASDYMAWYFNWDIPVPVPSDTNLGDNMKEGTSPKLINDKFEEHCRAVRLHLREVYMDGFVPNQYD